MNPARRLGLIIAVIAAGLGVSTAAAAQSQTTTPTVALDRYEIAPGERVQLTLSGFTSEFVDMSVCGNGGRRGSIDCNVRGTQAREINEDGTPTPAEIAVSVPPVPCPCIVRVASTDSSEVAVAPITLIGHPVGDVIEPTATVDAALAVDVVANRASVGFMDSLRAALGGPAMYDVTIQVRNRAPFDVEAVAVAAALERMRTDDVRAIDVPDPGALAAGATWQETVQVELPALTLGEVEWRATASGQGPSATTTDSTTSQPWLLYLFAVVLVVDLLVLLWRAVARALGRRRERTHGRGPGQFDDMDADEPEFGQSAPRREPVLTG